MRAAQEAGLLIVAAPLLVAAGSPAILVLTSDEAIRASDVALAEGSAGLRVFAPAANAANASNAPPREIPRERVVLLRCAGPPIDRPPAAWLCLRDGRRLRGDAIRLGRDAVTLRSSSRRDVASASLKEIASLYFRSTAPPRLSPPSAGVRILSVGGEPLDAPSVLLGEDAVTVEIDPSLDPVRLPLERVSALIWAGEPGDDRRDLASVELRSGERRKGELVSIGRESLVLGEGAATRTIARRDIESVWFGSHRGTPLEAGIAAPAMPVTERPRLRLGRDALGGPLRIEARMCESGIGLRAPVSLDIAVPRGALWLVAYAGASADAAPFGRVTIDVLVDGRPAATIADRRPGSPAEEIAVPIRGATAITVRASAPDAAGADAAPTDGTGCLGGLGDALFVD